MKILFYVEPLVEREDPLWKSPWLDFVKRFTYPLLSAGGDEHQCLAMVGEPLASTARDLLNDVAIVAIDPTSLLSRFGRSALDIASRWYRDKPGDVGVAQMAALVREAAGAFQPDVCISFSAAPFLRYAFPAAQVLYFEYGMFSRPPFPATAYLDPEGMYRSSYPMRHAAVLREREPQTDEVAVVDAVRTAFAPRLDQVGAPLLDAVRVARRSFRKAVLLPLQFSGYYAYDVNAAFTDQYDLLTQTLASVPEDCAVLVVEHPEHPVLKPATLQYLQQRHRNLVWLPESRGLYAAAQCLVPSVDAVVTVSSSVGWQTLLWRKPLLVVGSSHLDCIADSNDLSDLPRLLEPAPWPDWKERVLAWLLTHYFVPFDILFESPAAKLREVVSARAPVRLEAARVERLYVEAASRGDLLPALRGDQIHGLVGVETVVHLADRRVRSLERSLLRLGAEGGQLRVSLPSGAPVGRLQVRLADSPPVVAIRGLEIGQEGGPKEALSLGRIRPSGYSSQFALPGNVVLVGDTAPRSLLEFEVSLDGVTRPTLLVMELRRFSTSDLLYAAGVPRAARDESGEVQVEESKRSEQLTGNEARELTMPASIVGARNRALAESDERVEATYVLAADSRQRAETLYALLVERNTALEDARSRLAESATRAHQWATEALKRTDDLRAAEARLQQQQGIVGALQSALAASDAKRAHLLAESNEARAQVAELRHTIETTRAEAQRVADELNEEIVARGRWAVGLEKERDAERVRIEEQRGEISRLQVELASAAGQLHHARRDLAAVMNSTS
ncbi:MAG TPA: hypothetical protein DEH78_05045, partial [Solibacterales bacterium]|nr:hypothetical protein [Bryobacterales bacterium]